MKGAVNIARLLAAAPSIPAIPPSLQTWEWPLCCDDWCEFTGSPENIGELLDMVRTHSAWSDGACRNFVSDGPARIVHGDFGFPLPLVSA